MERIDRFVPLVGRFLLALIFVASGFGKIGGWGGTAAYMTSQGMPLVPLFLVGAIIVEIGGGLSVLIGFKTNIGAAALFLFLIPVTLIFHRFWALEGMERQIQMAMFLKNLAIMGGLLLLFAFGPGPLSLDNRKNSSSEV